MVIENNVSTINSKIKMEQELNPKVKVTKSLFSKMKKNRIFLAYLNQLWYVLQKLTKKVNNMVIENSVHFTDS